MIPQKTEKKNVSSWSWRADKATVADDYQNLKEIVLEKRRDEMLDKWIREKQKHTYVRINENWRNCTFKYPGWIKDWYLVWYVCSAFVCWARRTGKVSPTRKRNVWICFMPMRRRRISSCALMCRCWLARSGWSTIVCTCFVTLLWIYEKINSVEAFGNVRMEQGDTLFIYGDYLYYDGMSQLAMLRDNVRMINRNRNLLRIAWTMTVCII